jgi:N-acylneuraminate cytidylyltransferase
LVLTSENSKIVEQRMNKLHVETFLGVKDKYSLLNKLLIDKNILRSEVAYIGDDINDLSNIISVAWGICPQNAELKIKINSDLILSTDGGKMSIREATEFLKNYNERF